MSRVEGKQESWGHLEGAGGERAGGDLENLDIDGECGVAHLVRVLYPQLRRYPACPTVWYQGKGERISECRSMELSSGCIGHVPAAVTTLAMRVMLHEECRIIASTPPILPLAPFPSPSWPCPPSNAAPLGAPFALHVHPGTPDSIRQVWHAPRLTTRGKRVVCVLEEPGSALGASIFDRGNVCPR